MNKCSNQYTDLQASSGLDEASNQFLSNEYANQTVTHTVVSTTIPRIRKETRHKDIEAHLVTKRIKWMSLTTLEPANLQNELLPPKD